MTGVGVLDGLRLWTPRNWLVALGGAVAFGLLLGLPTDLVPNPIFGRQIEAPVWAYYALAVSAVLAGMLAGTYVRQPTAENAGDAVETSGSGDEKRFAAGGLLALFAVGCPTCNALVVIALGTTGALTLFEPVQPLLAAGGIGLLGWALRRRLTTQASCKVPSRR